MKYRKTTPYHQKGSKVAWSEQLPEVEVRADRVKRKNEVTASKAHTPGIIPGRKKTNAEIMAEARKNQEIEQNSPNPGGYKKPDVNLADVGRNFRKPGNVEIIYNQPQPNIQDIRDIATYDGGVLPTAVISAQRPNLRNEEVSVVNVPVERARQFPAEESRNPNYLTHEDVLNAESIKGQGQRQRGFFERVGRVAGGLQGAAGDQTSRISRNLGARVIKSVDRKLGSLVAPGQTQMVTPKNNVVTPGWRQNTGMAVGGFLGRGADMFLEGSANAVSPYINDITYLGRGIASGVRNLDQSLGRLVSRRKQGGTIDKLQRRYQQGGSVQQSTEGSQEELVLDFAVRYLVTMGVPEEDIMDPQGNLNPEHQQELEQVFNSQEIAWSDYAASPDEYMQQFIGNLQAQTQMARKGAKLKRLSQLRIYKK